MEAEYLAQSLAGFPVSRQMGGCWRSDECQREDSLESSLTIHVWFDLGMGSPPYGGARCVKTDLAPKVVDIHVYGL